jgi:ribosomal protein S20
MLKIVDDIKIQGRLRNKIRKCQDKSITKRCKESIEKYLGKDRGKEFEVLYGIRSKIAHGTIHFNTQCPNYDKAFALAKDLLLAQITRAD